MLWRFHFALDRRSVNQNLGCDARDVPSHPWRKRRTIAELGLSRSTFYRWQRRYRDQGEAGLVDRKREPGAVWNRLRPQEQTLILGLRRPPHQFHHLAFFLRTHSFISPPLRQP
jgi:hypothetical protein